jgi:hypothetical protein
VKRLQGLTPSARSEVVEFLQRSLAPSRTAGQPSPQKETGLWSLYLRRQTLRATPPPTTKTLSALGYTRASYQLLASIWKRSANGRWLEAGTDSPQQLSVLPTADCRPSTDFRASGFHRTRRRARASSGRGRLFPPPGSSLPEPPIEKCSGPCLLRTHPR